MIFTRETEQLKYMDSFNKMLVIWDAHAGEPHAKRLELFEEDCARGTPTSMKIAHRTMSRKYVEFFKKDYLGIKEKDEKRQKKTVKRRISSFCAQKQRKTSRGKRVKGRKAQ